ncbi:possible pyrimidine permease in reductive pathway [Mesobacillus boroniphilus JCM 21738]|uniref:Possible pyrimidine permease in reductive pathway n=1 Tax=Mesobacillus boroniphilus JCM 21738 TaxID=1294265 RepID=W4RNE0_9BACI|nr:possible pyrimidine permease in reductive pathway [Mesobacillus boroniphilus JCM 21738]
MAGIVGIIVQPWSLFGIIIPALLVIGGILSAIVGILFTDYYILRKRRVNVQELYEEHGQFRYLNGFNMAGMIAWILGGAAAYMMPSYSFIVGFAVGAIAYYVLAKYWWFEKYKQAEIEDPSDEKYLGITVGRDWSIEEGVETVVVPEATNPINT